MAGSGQIVPILASWAFVQAVSSAISKVEALLADCALQVRQSEAAHTFRSARVADKDKNVGVLEVVVDRAVAGMIGVVADVEVGAGIDAGVVIEEGLVATKGIAACAVSEILAL